MDKFIIGVLRDIFLHHGTQAFDVVFPDGYILIIGSGQCGILNHPADSRLKGIQTGKNSPDLDIAVASGNSFNRAAECISGGVDHTDGVFQYGGINGSSFQYISVFKFGGVDQTDHNPVHGIFHVFFECNVIFIGNLQV